MDVPAIVWILTCGIPGTIVVKQTGAKHQNIVTVYISMFFYIVEV
jgi:hypothetical protein